MVSVANSSFELVFNYDYMETDKFARDYTFYNIKDDLIMFVAK